MQPERWRKAERLCLAALGREEGERAAFLKEASGGDEALLREVESLLAQENLAKSFLEVPAVEVAAKALAQEQGSPRGELPGFRAASGQPLPTVTSTETEDPMTGRQLGVYRLVRRVGQGGMAAVFLAERADGEFRQQVAIKLVPQGLGSDEVLKRFRTERQTLAGLDHPNIVKLLDGGSTPEGLPYLVMDYVEGSPIDEYCDRHNLSVEQRLRLFSKVCEAVQHAHQKLVIHRDLKPGNILVTAEGVPKLLDFGIAKVLEPTARALPLTLTGTRCMTPAYASPEQVRGKAVTPATDIYSLGAVLYELLTGHRPYRLKEYTSSEIERAICEQEPETPSTAVNRVETETAADGTTVTRTPEVVSQTREGQPEKLRRRLRGDLDNIVLKALEKEPERRYGSVEELARDINRHLQHLPVKARRSTLTYRSSRLVERHKIEVSAALVVVLALAAAAWFALRTIGLPDRVQGSAPVARIQSLAVLPLANLSGDPAQEYFSDGMTDALISELSQIGSVKVISRTSTIGYKNTSKSLPEIARELKVDGIIEGTVQRSGDRLRITAQLIQGPSDKHLWAASYERDMRDLFALERDVTQEIARQIRAQVTTQKLAPSAQRRPVNPKALQAYLQGNYHLYRFGRGSGEEEQREAQKYFQQAIDADPNFALAYVGMADAHVLLRRSSGDVAIARRAAERAVELDPSLSGAWVTLADFKFRHSPDWPGAEEGYRRAIALNPNNALAHDALGCLLGVTGRLDEGLRESEAAQELDPTQDHLSRILEMRRDHDRAIGSLLTILRADPDNGILHLSLYRNYAAKGMYNEAVQELESVVTLFGFPETAADLRRAFATSGYRGAMQQWAKDWAHLAATNRLFSPVNTAIAYAAFGDKDRAFYWLEQAYKYRDSIVMDIPLSELKVQPLLDPLRSDPRFKDLVRRVGFPP